MKWWIYLSLTILAIWTGACAPAAAPPPAPAPAPAPLPAAPQLSPEDAAWAKVLAEARKEGRLTVYGASFVGDVAIRVKRAFKERTGLDVEFIASTGAAMIERIKAERRAGTQVADVLSTAATFLAQAKMEGLTEAVGFLPELQNKEVWKENPIVDKEGHILFTIPSLTSPWINTKLVKPGEEPKSWRELLQPRWKGKISMGDPDTTPSPIYAYYMLVRKHGILDDAYFRELGKIVVLQPTYRMDAAAVARGDVDISFASTPTSTAFVLQAGAPVKAIDMLEGVIGSRAVAGSPLTQAPHPNAARVFINWWFSREGQYVFHEVFGNESIRKDVPNFLPVPAQLTPKKVFWLSPEDEVEIAKLQRDRTVKNLLLGK